MLFYKLLNFKINGYYIIIEEKNKLNEIELFLR
jgi:hypothetical protein